MKKILELLDGNKTYIGLGCGFATALISAMAHPPQWIVVAMAVVSASIGVIGRYHAGSKIIQSFEAGVEIGMDMNTEMERIQEAIKKTSK